MDRRVKRTKNAIKEAFLYLSRTQEVNKIKVSELAELADINRKTFYLHYVDVFGVLEEIQNELEVLEVSSSIDNSSESVQVEVKETVKLAEVKVEEVIDIRNRTVIPTWYLNTLTPEQER